MLCLLTGHAPLHPVVLPLSGRVYEREALAAYLSQQGVDPFSRAEMLIGDAVPLHLEPGPAPPLLPTATLVPLLLAQLLAEWDAAAVEVFELRRQLQQAKEELATALYHKDAALRVATRAVAERDELKQALSQLGQDVADAVPAAEPVPVAAEPAASDYAALVVAARDALFAHHKAHKPVYTLASSLAWGVGASVDIPACVSLSVFPDGRMVAGDASSTRVVSALLEVEQVYSTPGEVVGYVSTDAVPAQLPASPVVVPVVALGTLLQFPDNTRPPVSLPLGLAVAVLLTHPLLAHLLVAVLGSGEWVLYNAAAGRVEFHHGEASPTACAAIHPDGALLALGGAGGEVVVYELASGVVAGRFAVAGPISAMCFGGNGFWLAAAQDTQIQILDLRKGTIVGEVPTGNTAATAVVLDPACQWLVLVDLSQQVHVHQYLKKGKQWRPHTVEASATCLGWLAGLVLAGTVLSRVEL